jgi:hypothetical protein
MMAAGCETRPVQLEGNTTGAPQSVPAHPTDPHMLYLADCESFKIETDKQLRDNDKKIDALSRKLKRAGTFVKTKYEREVIALKQKNAELRITMLKRMNENEHRWTEFKVDYQRDVKWFAEEIDSVYREMQTWHSAHPPLVSHSSHP